MFIFLVSTYYFYNYVSIQIFKSSVLIFNWITQCNVVEDLNKVDITKHFSRFEISFRIFGKSLRDFIGFG